MSHASLVVAKETYNEEVTRAYNELMDMGETDADGRKERPAAIRLVLDWYENYKLERAMGFRSTRSIASRMKAARDTFTTLVGLQSDIVVLFCQLIMIIGRFVSQLRRLGDCRWNPVHGCRCRSEANVRAFRQL